MQPLGNGGVSGRLLGLPAANGQSLESVVQNRRCQLTANPLELKANDDVYNDY